jgi:hypothetical protein
VNYAIASELLEHKPTQKGFRVKLTNKGKAFYNSLLGEELASDVTEIGDLIGQVSVKEIDTAIDAGAG